MSKTVEEKIEVMRVVLIKLINYTNLTWTERDYLMTKLDEIVKE